MVAQTHRHGYLAERGAFIRQVEGSRSQAGHIDQLAGPALCQLTNHGDLRRGLKQAVELGRCVADDPVVDSAWGLRGEISPSPYLRAWLASARVLSVAAVMGPDGAIVCASSITSNPLSGRFLAGWVLIQVISPIWS
jgi:hypothetical protein